ncbi:MAG TPA: response regulator [Rhodothermales bacterium]|nr:response regulator [Rhodothermales bacterium]
MKKKRIEVIIADDGSFLETCSRYFDGTEIQVVATATSAEEAVMQAIVHQYRADILILDVDLGVGRYATDVLRELRKRSIRIKTLIISGLVHEVAYVLPFKGLVEGILHKNEDKALIRKAVRGIASGQTGFYSPECADILVNRDFSKFYSLSEDEIEVLYLLTKGYTNTSRLAGFFAAKHMALRDDDLLANIRRTKYLFQEDVPASKTKDKSVSEYIKQFVQSEEGRSQKFALDLGVIRKPILQEDGKVRYERTTGAHLSFEEQLTLLLKREEGRVRRDILPRIFSELEIESTIEALLWAQKWDLPKYYDLSHV